MLLFKYLVIFSVMFSGIPDRESSFTLSLIELKLAFSHGNDSQIVLGI